MSGERQDGRQTIDRVTEYLIRHGERPERAKEKAKEARIRNEQRDDGSRRG